MDNYMKQFLQAKKIEGLRENTLTSYKKTFDFVYKYFDKLDYTNLSEQCIQIFEILSCTMVDGEHKYSNATFNTRRKHLTTYFNWLIQQNIILINPIKAIPIPRKKEDDNPKPPNTEDLKKLLKFIDIKTYSGFRDYCFITLIVDTGIRPSEVIGLKEDDFNKKSKWITIRSEVSKTNEIRKLPLSYIVSTNLNKLIKLNKNFFYNTDLIFLTSDGEPSTTEMFQRQLRRYCERIGDIKITPYMLRHYFGTQFYENSNGDVYYLQAMMGHKKLATTQKYIKLNEKELEKRHKVNSPLSNVVKRNTRIRKLFNDNI